MSEEKDLEELRAIARLSRFEPDEVMVQRLRARVAERVARPATIWDLLAAWFRPVVAALAVLIVLLGFLVTRQTAEVESDLLASVSPLPAAQEVYRDVQ